MVNAEWRRWRGGERQGLSRGGGDGRQGCSTGQLLVVVVERGKAVGIGCQHVVALCGPKEAECAPYFGSHDTSPYH